MFFENIAAIQDYWSLSIDEQVSISVIEWNKNMFHTWAIIRVPPPIPDMKRHIANWGPVFTREVKPVAMEAIISAIPIGLEGDCHMLVYVVCKAN